MSNVDNKQLLGWVIAQQHKHLESIGRASKRFDRERRASVEATREELLSFASKASYMKRQREKEIERITKLKRLGIFAVILAVPVIALFSLGYYIYQGSNLAKMASAFFVGQEQVNEEVVEISRDELAKLVLAANGSQSVEAAQPDLKQKQEPSEVPVKTTGKKEIEPVAAPIEKPVAKVVERETKKEAKASSELASVYPLPPLVAPAAPPIKREPVAERPVVKVEPAPKQEPVVTFKQAAVPIDLKSLKPGDYIAPAGAKGAQSERVLSVFSNGDILTDLRMIDANKVKFFEVRG